MLLFSAILRHWFVVSRAVRWQESGQQGQAALSVLRQSSRDDDGDGDDDDDGEDDDGDAGGDWGGVATVVLLNVIVRFLFE